MKNIQNQVNKRVWGYVLPSILCNNVGSSSKQSGKVWNSGWFVIWLTSHFFVMKRQKSEKNSILSLHIVASMAQFSTHSSVSVRCKRAPWLSSDPALKLWWWWWKFTLDWWHVEQLSKDTNDGQLTSTLKNFGVSNHLFQTMKNWKWNSNKSMVWWRRFANSHHKK